MEKSTLRQYWRTNLRYLLILLFFWALFSFILPIFLVHELNHIRLGGFPLGFWIAFQGNMVAFVILMFIYTRWMNRLDKKYGVED